MAIDTHDKRRSAGAHLFLQVLPVADGSVNQGDRQQAAFLYRGIAAGGGGGGGTSRRSRLLMLGVRHFLVFWG